MTEEKLKAEANKYRKKIYVYKLSNGSSFISPDVFSIGYKVAGSKVQSLVQVVKPDKINKEKENANHSSNHTKT